MKGKHVPIILTPLEFSTDPMNDQQHSFKIMFIVP